MLEYSHFQSSNDNLYSRFFLPGLDLISRFGQIATLKFKNLFCKHLLSVARVLNQVLVVFSSLVITQNS